MTRAAWLALGGALVLLGWTMSRPRFASLPVPSAALAAAKALRAETRRKNGLPPDGLPGSPFGPRPDPLDPTRMSFHAGTDIACPAGTPCLAVDDGRVIEARESVNAGKLIRYDTARGRVSVMHLSTIDVTIGDEVKAGQVIGATGASGLRSTGAHLHLEFRPHGAAGAVDPLPLFPG